MEIKVANEAKQDIGIAKADEILGKINNQQITARCVKSVQKGMIKAPARGLQFSSSQKEIKIATLPKLNISKCVVIMNMYEISDAIGGKIMGVGGNDQVALFQLREGGLYLIPTGKEFYTSGVTLYVTSMQWQVIEFY